MVHVQKKAQKHQANLHFNYIYGFMHNHRTLLLILQSAKGMLIILFKQTVTENTNKYSLPVNIEE